MPVRSATASSSVPRPKVLNLINSGSTPGVLDITQPSRLLKEPGSILSFASFDPRTACGPSDTLDFRKLSLNEELYRPKRVVVETLPSGKTTWRFVPNARRAEGVDGEGSWPRVIEISGQLVLCSQEQWDIYKLDPLYDCYVKAYPGITVIQALPPTQGQRSRSPLGKRHVNGLASTSEQTPRKKVHYSESLESTPEDDDDEEGEVEEMIIDDQNHYRNPKSPTANRRKRQPPFTASNSKTTLRGADPQGSTHRSSSPFKAKAKKAQSLPPDNHKRKMDAFPESLRTGVDPHFADTAPELLPRNTANYAANGGKRTRTVSPLTAQRELQAKRREREELKRRRREEERRARMVEREDRFMKEVYADLPPEHTNGKVDGGDDEHMGPLQEETEFDHSTPTPPCEDEGMEERHRSEPSSPIDEETVRAAAIAESRRKLAELEADRPIWEKAAQERLARERAEGEAAKAGVEARKREEARRAQLAREDECRKREEEEARRRYETLQQERENHTRWERERRERNARWCAGPWSTARAIERFKETSDYFEMTRFSERDPLTVDAVPWPTLLHPDAFSLEDVDWASVELFFQVLKRHVRMQEYLSLVEKSHRRFHPDRWRSRNLLKNVADIAERDCMDVAATTVSQALTPIWQQARAMAS